LAIEKRPIGLKTAESENGVHLLIVLEEPTEHGHFTHRPSGVRNQQVRGSNPRASFDFSWHASGG
jgi:hypothetical protein